MSFSFHIKAKTEDDVMSQVEEQVSSGNCPQSVADLISEVLDEMPEAADDAKPRTWRVSAHGHIGAEGTHPESSVHVTVKPRGFKVEGESDDDEGDAEQPVAGEQKAETEAS